MAPRGGRATGPQQDAGDGRRRQARGRGTVAGGPRQAAGDGSWADDQEPERDAGHANSAGQREGRSQLNSSAPDFTPGAFTYGGFGGETADYWGWQHQVVPMTAPPLWREYADQDGTKYYYNSKTGLCQWERPAELDPPMADEVAKGRDASGTRRDSGAVGRDSDRAEQRRVSGGEGGVAPGSGSGTAACNAGGSAAGGRGSANRNRRRGARPEETGPKKDGPEFGPPGCNLFVFHLPDDWADDDLHEYFAPHGNVVSAKVMKELGTGRSRGFGFVSYEDRVSAATAIKKMQGYKILGKRLKVEFKKGEQEGGRAEADDMGMEHDEDDVGLHSKKSYPDDERLIGYLRAISAKNVVQSLKESEGGVRRGDAAGEAEGDDP